VKRIATPSPKGEKTHRKAKGLAKVQTILLCSLGALLLVAGVLAFVLLRDHAPELLPMIGGTATMAARQLEEIPREAQITPNPRTYRDLSYLAADVNFDKEGQINTLGIWNGELFFSAGTGSLDDPVLTKLYTFNLETNTTQKINETTIYMGEYYETLINERWLVYLETDHGKNNHIFAMNRSEGKTTLIKNCPNGKPKLRLYGDTLIWMEQDETEDKLYMVDLITQENLPLYTFSDVATYGTSAPSIYGAWIVWAGPDPENDGSQTATSAIYYINLEEDIGENGIEPRTYSPDTYVHEPLFNGSHFVWIDTNKSFHTTLYVSQPQASPVAIATGISAYGLGDGIVVYGQDNGIWVYVIATGETCRLTSESEQGILPQVHGRTVVWQSKTDASGKDVLRYKILTDEELYPSGLPEDVSPFQQPTMPLEMTTTPAETVPAETTAAAGG